jgi:dinuclear metal center YbgI/SA1388 family protein
MKIKEIIAHIESIAPLAYQEAYDNSGMICGNPDAEAKSALVTLDCTEEVLDEAIALGCNLIVAHHPIVFSGLKKITGKNYVERVLIKAIKNDITIYAAHTNLDNVHNGVNAQIAKKLGLSNTRILSPRSGQLRKLITFCPIDKAEEVRKAIFAAGAGHIGNYDECSFNAEGFGTFRAGDNADPYVGEKGKEHREKELKIESIYSLANESAIVAALLAAHPYEEVAYDIIPLANTHKMIGSGMVGELDMEIDEMTFLKNLKKLMQTDCVRHTKITGKRVKKVAVCGGSGSFLLNEAIGSGAEVFVTADFKYHQFFDADNKIVIADIGHYESEQFTKQLFYDLLTKKFPIFAVHLSKINTNPINYI